MAAYLVAQINVTDPEQFEKYRDVVPAVIAEFGGRYLVRGGEMEVVEGTWAAPRLVIIEFPDMAGAKSFYHSDAYQKILPLRLAASEGNAILVEGI